MLLALLALTTSLVVASPSQGAEAQGCSLPSPLSDYVATVQSAERCDYQWYLDQIAASGKLTTLGVNASMAYPTGVTPGAPGDVIRVRPLYPSPAGPGTMSSRIMYWTMDRQGNAVPATGLMVQSQTSKPLPTEERPVVIWNHGTVGISKECAWVNDLLLAGLPADEDIVQPYVKAVYHAVVGLPDYIGQGVLPQGDQYHSYLSLQEHAQSSIDMVRAIHNLQVVTGAGTHWAQQGHSQGALTTQHAAEIEGDYAPELTLEGSVALASAGDMRSFVDSLVPNSEFFVGIAAIGLEQAYPEVDASEILVPEWESQFRQFVNHQGAAPWVALGNGLPQYTPDGGFQVLMWNKKYGKLDWPITDDFTSSNVAFSSPSGGKPISGCMALSKWGEQIAGEEIFQPDAFESDSWEFVMNEFETNNSAGFRPVGTPLRAVVFNCDELAPLAYNPTTKARLPMCYDALHRPTVTPGDGEGVLPDGYVPGPSLWHLLRLCSHESPGLEWQVYGEVDIDGDMVTDPGWELNGNGEPDVRFGHNQLGPHSLVSGSSALADTKEFIERVWGVGNSAVHQSC